MQELDGGRTTRAERDERRTEGTDRGDPWVGSRQANVATVRERVLAYVVDAAVVVGALLALTRGRSTTRRLVAVVAGSLVGATGYHVVLEGAGGQTVGKQFAGVAVVDVDGGACGYRAATVRTLARAVDWLPAGYLLGFLSMAATERRRRIGDLAADTVVVRSARNQD